MSKRAPKKTPAPSSNDSAIAKNDVNTPNKDDIINVNSSVGTVNTVNTQTIDDKLSTSNNVITLNNEVTVNNEATINNVVANPTANLNAPPVLKRFQMIEYCCRQINYLSHDDYRSIGSLLEKTDNLKFLIENHDGCRIDLDKLGDNILTLIYNTIYIKKSKLAGK